MESNLPELRDIHLPDGVSVFPPAYGWWVLLAGVILLFLLYELWLVIRRKSKKRYALRLLENVQPERVVDSARQISEILRRICVYKYPQAAVLYGREWIEFLKGHSKTPLDGREAKFLLDAPYMAVATTSYYPEDVEQLRKFCHRWIGENL